MLKKRLVPSAFALAVLPLALFVTGCGGPFLLLPGGELDGTPAAVPADWSSIREVKTVQIETRPADPYSVNIWVTGHGADAYLHAGASRSNWVEHLEADPRLRMRVEGTLYELAAERVEAPEEFARFAGAYEAKYGRRPRNEDVTEAYLFRLRAR